MTSSPKVFAIGILKRSPMILTMRFAAVRITTPEKKRLVLLFTVPCFA